MLLYLTLRRMRIGIRRLAQAQQILQESGTEEVVLLEVGAGTEILPGVVMSRGPGDKMCRRRSRGRSGASEESVCVLRPDR